jgi:hypothetical protein
MDIYKFYFIVFCFAVTLLSRFRCHSRKDWMFLCAGMGFTLTADYLMLVAYNNLAGLFTFWLVHVTYILRVSKYRVKGALAVFSALGVCVGAYMMFSYAIDATLFGAFVYAALFAADILFHIRFVRGGGGTPESALPPRNRVMMLAGLLLFALCDVSVMMYNLPRYADVSRGVSTFGYALIWVFYAPAQMLLAASAADLRRKV